MSVSRRGAQPPSARVRRPKVAGRMGPTGEDARAAAPALAAEAAAESTVPRGAVGVLDPGADTVVRRPTAHGPGGGQGPRALADPDRGRRRFLLVGSVLAVVLAVVAVAALLTRPAPPAFPPGSDDVAFADAAVTEQVTARTKEAVEAISSYGFGTLDADFDRARTFLSEERRAEFDEYAGVIRGPVEQRRLVVTAVVDHVGVQSIVGGTVANMLVLSTVTQKFEDGTEEVYRGPVKVVLELRDGQWIVTEME